LIAEVEAGREPDTALLGLNHLDAYDIDARLHDPRDHRGPLERVMWSLRELPLPWQLRDVDVAFTPISNLLPLVARARGGPAIVVVNYGLNTVLDRGTRLRRRQLSLALRSTAAIVCLGESQRLGLIERAGLDPERVHTVLLGADVEWFTPQGRKADEPYVLSVGKDMARDLQTFASAVGELDIRVEIVTLPRNLEGVSLPPNAHVRTGISSTELRDLYDGAACVVVSQQPEGYPYGSEGGGLTAICEAMAMGKPIVATERAILGDYLDGDELVAPRHPGALREAIAHVLGDDAVWQERSARSRRRAEERHSTRRFAEALAPILRAAAGGNLDAR
jgi:glycosyltransferase involved in cell wall biosynthesis